MKTAALTFLLGIFLAGWSLAEFREFKSSNGQAIKAELVSHNKKEVTLRRADGKEFTVAPNVFSPEDQVYIKNWMANTPVKVDYHFRIDAKKEKIESASKDLDYKKVKSEKWIYRVTVSNLSRDTVSNVTVKYRFFYDNEADGEFSASNYDGWEMKKVEGDVKLKSELPFNRSMEFTTKPATLEVVNYDYTTSKYKDSLRGIMVRILDSSEKVVGEWIEPVSSLNGKTWENTGKDGQKTEGTIIIR